jgi:hypothetical protein
LVSAVPPGEARSARKRRRPAAGGATEQTPKPEPTPAAWLDFLHRVWTRHGGVVEVPRFRMRIIPALRSFTVGQIERAMGHWVAGQAGRGRTIKLEYFLDELGAAVKAVDERVLMFTAPPQDLGYTAEEMAAMQAQYLARLRDDDLAFMQALLDTPDTQPPPDAVAAPSPAEQRLLGLNPG